MLGGILSGIGTALGGGLFGKVASGALLGGIGTLIMGGDGKDAIRNAAMFGLGGALMPGEGKNMLQGLGALFGPQQPGQGQAQVGAAALPAHQQRPAGVTEKRPLTEAPPRQARIPADPDVEGIAALAAPPMTVPEVEDVDFMSRDQARWNRASLVGNEGPRNVGGFSIRPVGGEDISRFTMDPILGTGMPSTRTGDPLFRANRLPSSRLGAMRLGATSFATGGEVEGPGTGTSDDIPAMIYQDGEPVREAALSDGEFVMTKKAVENAGGGDHDKGIKTMYRMMRALERGEALV